MTEAITPSTASQPIPASTAAFSTPNLAKKPRVGGTPARLNISTSTARPLVGSLHAKRFSEARSVTGTPSRSSDRMKAKVPTFMTA
ncbi:hypothetical protein D3C76_1685050 [compost metagenome]